MTIHSSGDSPITCKNSRDGLLAVGRKGYRVRLKLADFDILDRMADRSTARELAERSLSNGDPTGWFEELYHLAERQPGVVPWADKRPNPHLVEWLEQRRISGRDRLALVVGCGYGDDAEWLID